MISGHQQRCQREGTFVYSDTVIHIDITSRAAKVWLWWVVGLDGHWTNYTVTHNSSWGGSGLWRRRTELTVAITFCPRAAHTLRSEQQSLSQTYPFANCSSCLILHMLPSPILTSFNLKGQYSVQLENKCSSIAKDIECLLLVLLQHSPSTPQPNLLLDQLSISGLIFNDVRWISNIKWLKIKKNSFNLEEKRTIKHKLEYRYILHLYMNTITLYTFYSFL